METDCFQKKLTVQDRDMMLACPGSGRSGDQAAAHLLPGVPSVWDCLTVGSCLWVEANKNTGDVTMHVLFYCTDQKGNPGSEFLACKSS